MNTSKCLILMTLDFITCFLTAYQDVDLKSSRFTEHKIVGVCKAFKNSH